MEDKTILKKEELTQVSGGTDDGCGTSGRKCPACGSTRISFVGEMSDMGKFECEDCGCTFYGDI